MFGATVRRATAWALLLPSMLLATVYHTSTTPMSDIIDALQPGDAVSFDGDIVQVSVDRPIQGVQFIGGRAQWVLDADVVDCEFIHHAVNLMRQRAGKMRRCTFFVTHYGFGNLELTHTDSVCFYFCETWQLPGNSPRMQLNGFVRSVTWHKSFSEPQSENAFNLGLAPVMRMCAWDPVGNGHGTYITSPIVWDGRADVFFHVVRGNGVTFAHCNTEYNRWSSPIADFDNVTNCYLLCNGVGAANDANNAGYKTQPSVIEYHGYKQLGHYEDMVPFRGAAFRMGGMHNKSVASGSYKTWSIGIKAWLPCLHYDDAITVRDPYFEDWAWQRGTATVGFSDVKGHFMFGAGAVTQYGEPRYPVEGADIISPYYPRFSDEILAKRPGLGKPLGPSRIEAVKSLLAAGKTVQLGEGTYDFDATLRNGEIVGAGPDKTIVRFLHKNACATGAFRGYSNCTVTGGSWGYVNNAYALQSSFFKTVFRDNSEGGILINDNSQNDCIQEAEFYGGKFGIKTGHNGNTKDPNIDKLDIINCHFEGQSEKGIELYTDPEKVKNGQVAVLGCTFKDIGGAAIHIDGTQTHMVQQCTIENACHTSATRAAVTVESYKNEGAVAITHTDITGSNAAATGISFGGEGVISHCSVSGMGTAIRVLGRNAVVDHIQASDGNLEVAEGAYVYLARANMKNASCGINDSKVRIYSGSSFQEQQGSGVTINTAPPASVTNVQVERKTNDPDYPYLDDYNLITWEPVPDPGSTIIGYAVFAGGTEIGRTRAWRANGHADVLRGDPSGVPSTGAPADYELVRTEFRDPNVSNTNYTVKPINGAHKFPDGTIAPERKWTQPWGYFMTPDGNEFRVDKLDYQGHSDRWVEDTTRGLRVNAMQDGALLGTVAPTYITHDWGDFSVSSSVNVPTFAARSPQKVIAKAPSLSGRMLHVPSPMHVTVNLLDLRGRRLAVLCDGMRDAGKYLLPLPGEPLGAGTYIVSVRTRRHATHHRMSIVR